MAQPVFFGAIYIHFWEMLALPFYLLVIYLIANNIKRKNIDKNPFYKFYVWGLFVKIAGGIGFVLVYLFYWNGGDTTSYFESSMAFKNLLLSDPGAWLINEFGTANHEHLSLFNLLIQGIHYHTFILTCKPIWYLGL